MNRVDYWSILHLNLFWPLEPKHLTIRLQVLLSEFLMQFVNQRDINFSSVARAETCNN